MSKIPPRLARREQMKKKANKMGGIFALFTVISVGLSPHPFILILCYLIHELGHIFFARLMGARIEKLHMGSFHLSLSYDSSSLSYKREILVEAGGIIFNLLSVLLLLLFPSFGEGREFFLICSISLALMNLYPVSILDGGGILKNLLLCILAGDVAEKVAKLVSFICAILMWLIAVYVQIIFHASPSFFVISVFLLIKLCFSYI